ncbi:hypothetical protein G5B35_02020 [Parapusillimonas sp. SGNA-6]|nr:hypothetical protein [Parapusillimonas sp. SGNA-6]
MTIKSEFIDAVDDLLRVAKTIVNVDEPPQWQPNRDGTGHEAKLQVAVDGVMYGDVLIIQCVPTSGAFHFSFTHSNICVSRLDFDDGGHTNPLYALDAGVSPIVSGRHFHRWSLNTKFVNANGTLEELKNAEELPIKVRSFDAALRWFCEELNIFLPHDHDITFPRILI